MARARDQSSQPSGKLTMHLLGAAVCVLLLSGCASGGAVDMVHLRRASVSAFSGNDEASRVAAARREAAVPLQLVSRKPVAADEPLQVADLSQLVTAANLASPAAYADIDVFRGAKGGPSESYHALKAGGDVEFNIAFRGKQSALVLVTSATGDLELVVRNEAGQHRCADKLTRGVAFCRLRPAQDVTLRVAIHNTGKQRAVFSLLTN